MKGSFSEITCKDVFNFENFPGVYLAFVIHCYMLSLNLHYFSPFSNNERLPVTKILLVGS